MRDRSITSDIFIEHDGSRWYEFPWSATSGAHPFLRGIGCTRWGAIREVKKKIRSHERRRPPGFRERVQVTVRY